MSARRQISATVMLREADLGQQRKERLPYDRKRIAPATIDLPPLPWLLQLQRSTMPSKRSFIDSRPKLFIALKQIDMDTFFRHLFIIAERRYPVTLYEQLVIELTNRSFSLQAAYRSGGTPHELSDRESEPYDQQIKDFAHMIEGSRLRAGGRGLRTLRGGRRRLLLRGQRDLSQAFRQIRRTLRFQGGAFEGSFYRWPTAEARWDTSPPSSTLRSTPHYASPTRTSTLFSPRRISSCSPPTKTTQFVKLYPREKVAEIQGDHRFFQCSRCCTDEVWTRSSRSPAW